MCTREGGTQAGDVSTMSAVGYGFGRRLAFEYIPPPTTPAVQSPPTPALQCSSEHLAQYLNVCSAINILLPKLLKAQRAPSKSCQPALTVTVDRLVCSCSSALEALAHAQQLW